ncbi:hypothetical protein NHX12_027782 [Muraenolepis orangiensis]|uniref:Uncharacterized protein n=1 Tax=Muraenolepis orangiensis TaxID=630683 RepID=A0A9Q0EG64_9TELE|nr:hypothetical protein NHX12_027782 [Muraenolepis orangiensis]
MDQLSPQVGLTSPRWASPAPGGPHQPQVGLTSTRWASPAPDGPHQPQMGLTSPRWASPAPDGPHQPQVGLTSPRWASPAPGGPHQPQMGLTSPRIVAMLMCSKIALQPLDSTVAMLRLPHGSIAVATATVGYCCDESVITHFSKEPLRQGLT